MNERFILQDILLNQIRREGSIAEFITQNGEKFSGKLHGFDKDVLIIDLSDEKQVMLYKNAISSVHPSIPVLCDTGK